MRLATDGADPPRREALRPCSGYHSQFTVPLLVIIGVDVAIGADVLRSDPSGLERALVSLGGEIGEINIYSPQKDLS
jgi:hypothetical protein